MGIMPALSLSSTPIHPLVVQPAAASEAGGLAGTGL
jgi:hypothetical protein